MQPLEFLRQHPPFDRLAPWAMDRLGSTLEINWVPRDTKVLQRGGARSEHLFIIRKGSVRLERDGHVVQTLEEGDCFGFPSLIGRTHPHVDAVAAEDTLLYQVPEDTFHYLMRDAEFAGFFLTDLADRLRNTALLQAVPLGGELGTPVGQLRVAPCRRIAPTDTVGDAARRMRDAGVSCLIVDTDPPGMLTDRDLRSRVLAEGRGPSTLVADVATTPVRTIGAKATLFETLLFMLEEHVHHAPIEDAGAIVGVITDTDLLRLQVKSPLYLLRDVERMSIPDDLPRYSLEVAAMVEALHWGGLDALQIAPVVSRINEALIARLLKTAEARQGQPPAPYSFVVFGSEGRREQTLLTDQDNALVYADDGETHHEYFDALARSVVDHLIAAGFPACPGGFMAINWNRSLSRWGALFRSWVETPEPRALMEALNFFDFRPVCGRLDLTPLDERLLAGGREPMFLAHLARASLGLSPPLGPFRQIRQQDGGVDLKKGGIVPIVGLARLYALDAQSPVRGTLARLESAADAGTLSTSSATTLSEAFRFLQRVRLRAQLQAIKEGGLPDNRAPLDELSPLERQHLKDVFVAIREIQHATALRYGIARLA